MIRIAAEPWEVMVAHARRAYPNDCCGAMLVSAVDGVKDVRVALPLENVFTGEQDERYELRLEDLLAADRAARERGMELIGIYHSHPDCDAYFSETDLKNSCPWYSFLVLSIRYGFYHHANSWLPDMELTGAVKEKLIVERAAESSPPRFVVDGQTAADR